jgi:hypothetical protein
MDPDGPGVHIGDNRCDELETTCEFEVTQSTIAMLGLLARVDPLRGE